MNKFIYRSATKDDVSSIVMINNSRLDRESKSGFVLNSYSEDDVLTKIDSPSVFIYVVENNGQAVGYLELAKKVDSRIPDELDWVTTELKEQFLKASPIYIDRICLLEGDYSKGAGSYIYQLLDILFPKTSFYCFIVTSPITNENSERFHQKHQFIKVSTFNSDYYAGFNNYQSALYFRPCV
jgi:hypothetical protein